MNPLYKNVFDELSFCFPRRSSLIVSAFRVHLWSARLFLDAKRQRFVFLFNVSQPSESDQNFRLDFDFSSKKCRNVFLSDSFSFVSTFDRSFTKFWFTALRRVSLFVSRLNRSFGRGRELGHVSFDAKTDHRDDRTNSRNRKFSEKFRRFVSHVGFDLDKFRDFQQRKTICRFSSTLDEFSRFQSEKKGTKTFSIKKLSFFFLFSDKKSFGNERIVRRDWFRRIDRFDRIFLGNLFVISTNVRTSQEEFARLR